MDRQIGKPLPQTRQLGRSHSITAFARIERHVRTGLALHADDPPVPVLDPGKDKTKTGRLWTVVRDERPFGATTRPAAFYRYSPTARQSMRGRCSPAVEASSTPTATPASPIFTNPSRRPAFPA